ncbi:MAG: class I SAM-dependent methyltransferase [Candidatus Diapherotrites archaeon]|uniref:Class I SAM-dependent methyltransferase n=1 Tax=Candidatus Iainarchaeum sp. TaxID=3101447 RepID=A0A8T4KTJ5_9ARCH|nr:class I SAM-dependent methyltransferase [Candidatus Diapherotrites archaeon]
MKSRIKQRFSGTIGQEYTFFENAFPHVWPLQKTIAKEIAKAIPKNAKEFRILELGCGPGPTTIELLKADKRIRITAIDNEPTMIKQAKKFLQNYENRVKLVLVDALEFLKKSKNESFNAVATGWMLHNFPQKARQEAHKEIFRVIKKNGAFVNGDKIAEENKENHKAALEWSLKRFRSEAKKFGKPELGEEWVKHMIRDEKPDLIMREAKTKKQLVNLGFSKVQIVWRQHLEAVITARK